MKIDAQTNGIVEGTIWKQLLLFFFPILIGTFFQQLYNTVDAIIVGRFVSKAALGAVGMAGRITELLVGFFVGLSSGAGVVIAQFFGAKDQKTVSKAIQVSVLLAVVGGVALMLAGLLSARSSLIWLDTPEDVAEDALIYLNVYYAGLVACLLYNMGTGILRALGDSRTPLYVLILCCGVNILLDLWFVLILHMGVFGVALATVLSQVISAVVILLRLHRRFPIQIRTENLRSAGGILRQIIRIGLPAGMQSVLYSFSHLVVQSAVNSFGTDAVAAWTAVLKIDGLLWMVMSAFGVSITTFAGQNFGAGRYDRVRRGTKVCLGMTTCTILLLSGLFLLFAEPLLRFFNDDPSVISIGLEVLRVRGPFYFTFAFVEILSGTIRGAGEALRPMVITCICTCVLRSGWALLIFPLAPSIRLLAWAYPVTWIVPSIVFIIYYSRMKWMERCMRWNCTN